MTFFADVLVSRTPSLSHLGPASQVWKARNVADRWGLDVVPLGAADAGTGLTEAEAVAIKPSDKKAVIDYVAEAFSSLDRAVGELDDSVLSHIIPGPPLFPSQREPDTYGDNLVIWITRAYEHLGIMEALKGMLGFRGSVGD